MVVKGKKAASKKNKLQFLHKYTNIYSICFLIPFLTVVAFFIDVQ